MPKFQRVSETDNITFNYISCAIPPHRTMQKSIWTTLNSVVTNYCSQIQTWKTYLAAKQQCLRKQNNIILMNAVLLNFQTSLLQVNKRNQTFLSCWAITIINLIQLNTKIGLHTTPSHHHTTHTNFLISSRQSRTLKLSVQYRIRIT